jgi:nucleoside-diphosphate-sugar epimerase
VPTALVTGATGLVGSHIVDQLLEQGWSVRALVRRPTSELPKSHVDQVVGDVLDVESFTRAGATCNVIFHTAAVVTTPRGWEAFRRTNVDGTANAIIAAERVGARLMHLSSVAVYARRYSQREKIHEDMAREPLSERSYYARTKRESEDMVLDAHARGRIWATAVRPCIIYGTRDRQFIPRIARGLRFGVAPILGSGQNTLPIVAAENVAQGALLAAAHSGAGGRAYNLSNDFDVTVRDFLRFAGEGLGRRIRIIRIPTALASAGFHTWLRLTRLLGGGTAGVVSRGSLDMAMHDNPFTSARARAELGWNPRARPEDALVGAFRWWRERE